MAGMYVHYGCGLVAPKEWVNFDSSFTLKYEKTPFIGKLYKRNSSRFESNVRSGDIVSGLPIPNLSCRGIYASHVLEHLALDDFHRALTNTYRMLEPGGVFRLVVPDLEWAAREYVRQLDDKNPKANEFFLDETCLGLRTRKQGVAARMQEALSTSRHFWMWDELSLRNGLEEHGFRKIRRCHFGDAADPMFHLVESIGRFERAIGMEALR